MIPRIFLILSFFIVLAKTFASELVSIDEFDKMNQIDREKLIQQAPAEQREELKKIDLHLNLLSHWGGEEELKVAKETQVLRDRGLGDLEMFFIVQSQMWDHYIGATFDANRKAAMPRKLQIESVENVLAKRETVRKRLPDIHSLIIRVAGSPEALDLDQKVKKIAEQWSLKMTENSGPSSLAFTEKERDEIDEQANVILEEIKKLPTLQPEEIKKEVNAVTDDKMRGRGYIRPLYLPPSSANQIGLPSIEN